MIIVTVRCPVAAVDDARQLAMVLNDDPASVGTFNHGWQDASGTPFYAASGPKPLAWIERATQPLERPAWDTDEPYIVNMAGAGRAHAAMIWVGPGEPIPDNIPDDAIVAIGGMDGRAALAALGLSPVPPAEE